MSNLAARTRMRERRKQRDRDLLNALQAAGKCCGNCSAFKREPQHGRMVCDYHSFFGAIAATSETDLCIDWMERIQPKGESDGE